MNGPNSWWERVKLYRLMQRIMPYQPYDKSEVDQLRDALAGIMEIEEDRIANGFFNPNDAGWSRIEAGRAALAKGKR